MASNKFQIVISALDTTDKALGAVRKRLGAVGRSVDRLKKKFPNLSAIAGGAFKKIANGLKSVAKFAGIAAVATAGIFAVMIKSSMSAIDNLGKTARKIGVTTEALASMRYAAKLTGVETATMDMALQRFTRRAAEAAKGTGEAKGALKELRLDARELVKLPLEEQMQALAGAFEEVETDADKVRLAMKLFDSEGVALVNTLGLGKEGLIELAEEADNLGIVLSGSAVQGVEDANDEFTRLGTLFKGIKDNVTAALAPALGTLADTLKNKVLTAIKETDGGVAEFGRNLAIKILEGVGKAVLGLQALVNGVIRAFNDITSAAAKFTGFFRSDDHKNARELEAQMKKINDRMKERDELIKSQTGRMQKSSELAQQSDQAQLDRLQALLDKRVEIGDTTLLPEMNFGDAINETIENLIAGINGVGEARENASTKGNLVPPNEVVKSGLQKNFETLKEVGKQEIKFEEMRADEKVKHVAGGLAKNLAIAGQNSKKMFKLSQAAGIAEALVSTYVGAAKSMGAYPFPINVVMAAASIAAGMAQVSAIKSQTPPSFDGGGFTGSGARSGGVDGKGGFHAILHPNETVVDHTKPRKKDETKKATQGLVSKLGMPELTKAISKMPSFEGGGYTGGKMSMPAPVVVNNVNATQSNREPVVVNQTINVTTGVQSTVRAEIANLLPQISDAAKQAVLEETAKGGFYQTNLRSA